MKKRQVIGFSVGRQTRWGRVYQMCDKCLWVEDLHDRSQRTVPRETVHTVMPLHTY